MSSYAKGMSVYHLHSISINYQNKHERKQILKHNKKINGRNFDSLRESDQFSVKITFEKIPGIEKLSKNCIGFSDSIVLLPNSERDTEKILNKILK